MKSLDNTHSTDLVPATETKPANYSANIAPGDLALPRLLTAQPTSAAVQDGLVSSGSLYGALDKDDPEPKVLYEPGQEQGVTVHVIAYRSIWYCQDPDTERFMVIDRDGALLPEDPKAQAGYEILALAPTYDLQLPCSWLLKSSGASVARRMFTIIKRAGGAPWSQAFELTTVQRQNDLGRWFVPQAKPTKAKAEHVKAAAQAALLLGVPGGDA